MSADKQVSREIEKQAWAKYAECVHIPKEWRKEMKNCFESAFRKGFEAGMKWQDARTHETERAYKNRY